LEHHVLDALTAIALQESENYQGIRKAMEDFIEQNTGQLQNVNFLNLFIEKLDQKYYVSKSEGLSIGDVRAKLGTVFSCPCRKFRPCLLTRVYVQLPALEKLREMIPYPRAVL